MSRPLLLLLVGLPPKPSSLRVRVWRRLRSLGAVAAQALGVPAARHAGAVRGLPVARAGDPARRRRRDAHPRPADRERDARPTSCGCSTSRATRTTASSPARYRKVLQSLDRKSAPSSARVQEELAQLAKDHQRIRDIDFFDAPGGAEVRRLEEAIAMRTRRPETARREEPPALDLTKLRGRRWVTRPRPHIDRIASAWLIKRFIDAEAEFVFAPPARLPGGRHSVRRARTWS